MTEKAEGANPQAGAAQVAPEDVTTRMMNYLNQSPQDTDDDVPEEREKPESTDKTEQEGQPDSSTTPESQSELTPDDLPGDEQKPEGVDEFEIVHSGQQHRLSREKVIELAQKGFDYTQKTQQLAEQTKAVTQTLHQLQTIEQVNAQVMQEAAECRALEAQLANYQNVDWVRLATDDPIEYPKHRAQFDVLNNAFQGAINKYNNKRGAVEQALAQINMQALSQEYQRLPEVIPEWKEPEKMEKGKQEVLKYLTSLGANPEVIGYKMNDAISVSIAYKAMKYDQLVKSKHEKSKQLQSAPPVQRPGATQGRDAAKAATVEKLQSQLRKSGDLKDAAALLLTRM